MSYQPPFSISARIINQISAIAEQLGRLSTLQGQPSPQLRKQNRIRTIQSTLAIEGNSLSLDQITAILEGKRVLGNTREIAEVQGAIRATVALPTLDPTSIHHFKEAHYLLTSDILTEAGKFRKSQVGIHKGEQIVHIAPSAKLVPNLMPDLFDWLKASPDHALIKSSVFHYELEFIHPFIDGNGRMGRLWQTLILGQWNSLFYLLPIESLIKDQQNRYYQVLEDADRAADITKFIEFMLDIIHDTLIQNSTDQVSDQVSDQVQQLLSIMDDQYRSVQELMARLKLSHKPTFRKNYLLPARLAGLVQMQYPDKPRSPKQRYKKS
ncbi:hypothetical protein NIES4071_64240 [Calothrix sp. NIES-4071]|nr:hypothetical protein NIES4071_64240 [Calothrix sp. NIES-4071]BAZ60728.1 hypothetical protein NIES4105_64200 [Calothrix sp. NIES-4105]